MKVQTHEKQAEDVERM